jgi:hypothetical protein
MDGALLYLLIRLGVGLKNFTFTVYINLPPPPILLHLLAVHSRRRKSANLQIRALALSPKRAAITSRGILSSRLRTVASSGCVSQASQWPCPLHIACASSSIRHAATIIKEGWIWWGKRVKMVSRKSTLTQGFEKCPWRKLHKGSNGINIPVKFYLNHGLQEPEICLQISQVWATW